MWVQLKHNFSDKLLTDTIFNENLPLWSKEIYETIKNCLLWKGNFQFGQIEFLNWNLGDESASSAAVVVIAAVVVAVVVGSTDNKSHFAAKTNNFFWFLNGFVFITSI